MNTVIDVALPIFAVIFVGYLTGRVGVLGPASSEALNRYVYWVALPALLFFFIARIPLSDLINWGFLGAFFGSSLVVWAMGMLVGRLLGERASSVLVMQGMNASFANVGYMGIPLAVSAFGADNIAPALLATVAASAIAVPISIVALELTGERESRGAGAALWDVGRALVTNPLLIAAIAGLAMSLSQTGIASPIERLLDLLAVSASPCALIAIGLFLANRPLRAGLLEVGWVTVLKLIWHPLICWWLIIALFPLDPYWAASAIILSALPTGTLTFVVAQQYGIYVERTSGIILVSTIVSVVTLSLVMAVYGPFFASFVPP